MVLLDLPKVGIFLIAASIVFQTISVSTNDQENLGSVSSFYGQGCFFPWVLTAIPTLLSCEWHYVLLRFLRRLFRTGNGYGDAERGLLGREEKDDRRVVVDFDAGMLAIVAFPLVASADVVFRVRRGEHSPQRDAAVCVCRVGAMISYAALVGIFMSSEVDWYEPCAEPTSRRRAAWTITWSACTLASLMQPGPSWFCAISMSLWWWTYISIGTMGAMVSDHRKYRRGSDDDGWDFLATIIFVIAVMATFTVMAFSASIPESPMFRVGLSVPRTASSLRDMDQWFPFACTLLLVTGPICVKLYRVLGKRNHPSANDH